MDRGTRASSYSVCVKQQGAAHANGGKSCPASPRLISTHYREEFGAISSLLKALSCPRLHAHCLGFEALYTSIRRHWPICEHTGAIVGGAENSSTKQEALK